MCTGFYASVLVYCMYLIYVCVGIYIICEYLQWGSKITITIQDLEGSIGRCSDVEGGADVE